MPDPTSHIMPQRQLHLPFSGPKASNHPASAQPLGDASATKSAGVVGALLTIIDAGVEAVSTQLGEWKITARGCIGGIMEELAGSLWWSQLINTALAPAEIAVLSSGSASEPWLTRYTAFVGSLQLAPWHGHG